MATGLLSRRQPEGVPARADGGSPASPADL